MRTPESEFERFSDKYDELLKDPIRDCFLSGDSDFFHERKRDLIREYFRRRGLDTRRLRYLDLGCGSGELLTLLRNEFGEVAGCDPSSGMMERGALRSMGVTTRVQVDPTRIPFESGDFDFVTAVCVYHHVLPHMRPKLTHEVRRVLRPGGVFTIIEHNPYNPVTRLIVRRTPVDADAVLLRSAESRDLLRAEQFIIDAQSYFLYLPKGVYRAMGKAERVLERFPLGGQYAVFGRVHPGHS